MYSCPKNMFIIYVLNCLLFLLLFQNIISLEKEDEYFNLPDEYDLRKEYKECESLRDIRDQGSICGGCWAFATAEVISDRICVDSGGKKQVNISANELLTCCDFCFNFSDTKRGCGGGNALFHLLGFEYIYWIKNGLPDVSCKPFHFYKEYNESNLKCSDKCDDGSDPIKYYGSDYKLINKNETAIMNEIYHYGSVRATFSVYDDFKLFFWFNEKGIYELNPEYKKGNHTGHSIKIIGWGVDNKNGREVKYWLCANSWGRDWGDNGFFKIKRGVNECGIESHVTAPYISQRFLYRTKESMVVYEDNFYNFKNFKDDFM